MFGMKNTTKQLFSSKCNRIHRYTVPERSISCFIGRDRMHQQLLLASDVNSECLSLTQKAIHVTEIRSARFG